MRVEWSLLIIPVTCMPSKAKMRMKRKRRKRSERMERIELRREITRFLRLAQYLVTWKEARCSLHVCQISDCHLEDPQESECSENWEAKLSSFGPDHRNKNNYSFKSILFSSGHLIKSDPMLDDRKVFSLSSYLNAYHRNGNATYMYNVWQYSYQIRALVNHQKALVLGLDMCWSVPL